MKLLKNNFILVVYLITSIIFLIIFPQWKQENYNSILSWDAMGYYLYLPSFFIYKDLLHLQFIPDVLQHYQPSSYFYQAHQLSNDNWVMSYTMGVSILQLPFFLLAQISAKIFHFKMDGFSQPYQFWIMFSGILYGGLGIFLQRKILSNYFGKSTVQITLIALLLATNLFFYCFFENAMSHVYSFFLLSAFIHLTIKWHANQSKKSFLLLCSIFGLIILTRPSDGIVILIPLFWNIYSIDTFKQKMKILWKSKITIIIGSVIFLSLISVQLVYWKLATANWFYNSYTVTNQQFDFLKPHIIKGFFSSGKGWLIYSPIMLFSIFGLLLFRKNGLNKISLAVVLFFLLNSYIVFSWQVWWYCGGFGARAMIQSYALLAIPFANAVSFFQTTWKKKFLFSIVIVLCILLNIFKIYQYKMEILPHDNSNSLYILNNFFSVNTLNTNQNFTTKNKLICIDSSSNIKILKAFNSVTFFSTQLSKTKIKANDTIVIQADILARNKNQYALNNGKIFIEFFRKEKCFFWTSKNLTSSFKSNNDFNIIKQFSLAVQVPKVKTDDSIYCYIIMDADEEIELRTFAVQLIKNKQ